MTRTHLCLALAAICGGWSLLAQAPVGNPITNGGFEEVGADGWAVDWERVGLEITLTHEAHTGHNAALLRRTQEAIDRKAETGLNRRWQPHSGQQGAMLAERKGGVKFWYKVPAAPPTAQLRFYMIPMSADPFENTGGARQWFEVPVEHFGDGQWHQGILAYDFTDNEKCQWVQVAPRLQGDQPAEWILDDIEWVSSAGPLAKVVNFGLQEIKGREGQEAEVSATIQNVGDQPLEGTAELALPAYLQAAAPAAVQKLPRLSPGEVAKVQWRVVGWRDRGGAIGLTVTGGAAPCAASLPLRPQLEDVRLETEQFVLWPGKQTAVRVLVENTGTAAAQGVELTLSLPPEVVAVGPTRRTLEVVAPGTQSRVEFAIRAVKQTPLTALRCRWAGEGKSGEVGTELVIGAPPPTPGRLPRDAYAVSCASCDILFPRNDFGYGIGWIYTRPGGELVGVLPYLGRLAVAGGAESGVPLYASQVDGRARGPVLGADPAQPPASGLIFTITSPSLQNLGVRSAIQVTLAAAGPQAAGTLGQLITYQISCPAPPTGRLLALAAPLVYVGEGAFGGEQDEALYPGLEWLERGEHSSSALDIAPEHPDRLRYLTHPHFVTVPLMAVRRGRVCVGLLWHARSRWNDGTQRPNLKPDRSDVDRPSALFASPDRFHGHAAHLLGLLVPTVPEYVEVNRPLAKQGWPAEGVGARTVRLVSALYVNPQASSVLEALRAWYDVYGLPAPRPLPHARGPQAAALSRQPPFRGYGLPDWVEAATRAGNWPEPSRQQWIDEIEWSMQAYLRTLWDEEKKGWLSSKGGPAAFASTGPRDSYLYDCVLAARLTDDAGLRAQLEERIGLLKRLYPHLNPQADDLGFNFGQPVNSLLALAQQAAELRASQDPDGGWRFHPYIAQSGLFKGMDYSQLGYEGQEAVGLVARKAWTILRAARMSGDAELLAAGLKALRYMEKFRVPRAAQVWEVPVHTPDILAAADACEAYLEAYRATGDRQWLARAVYWEETGLPFLYHWDVDAFPWMRYSSIPVFGSSWMHASWFGRPVQWNGLRWAFAALKLADVDQTYPWRMLAAGVTISAIYQQGEGENDLALWPDSIYTLDGSKSGWIFAPRLILHNVYKLLGYEPEPVTVRVQAGGGSLYLSACGKIANARLEEETLHFELTAPEPVPTRVVVCGVAEPAAVRLNGAELAKQAYLPPGEVVGWAYHAGPKILEISPGRPGHWTVDIVPTRHQPCVLMPPAVTQVNFEFTADDGGWRPAHDLTPFSLAEGCLVTRAVGGDPYMERINCRLDGEAIRRIHVRMAVSAGTGAEFYWTTTDSPTMAEDKTVKIPIQGDGQFHDYYFEVGAHPGWQGKTITAIRLDPMSGAREADIRIDFIRGE
jgi:hypothetical protein